MPWSADDAAGKTKLADTPRLKRMWAHVANGMLEETGSEERSIRAADAAVRREHAKRGPGERMLRGE